MPESVLYLALAATGVIGGFLNTIAGGGSLVMLPALIVVGLPADIANGTNRLAVLSQSLSGALAFRREGKLPRADLPRVVAPAVLGSFLGSLGASFVPADALKLVLLATMVAMALLTLLVPTLFRAPDDTGPLWQRRALGIHLGLFGAGLYGGFIQAGVGFLLLGVLAGIARYDVVRATALKVFCTLIFGAIALTVFIAAGKVDWPAGLILAGTSAVGSLLGVRFALRAPPTWVRWIVFACVTATCVAAYLR